MPRDKDKEAKLVRQKTKQAVDLALAAKWREAIEVNKSILEIAPDDVDAYNRLGRAYLETGEYDKAREAYQRPWSLILIIPLLRKIYAAWPIFRKWPVKYKISGALSQLRLLKRQAERQW